MATPEEVSDKPAADKNGSSQQPEVQPLPKPFRYFLGFVILYILCLLPFWTGHWWSDKVTSWRGLVFVAVATLVFYFAGIVIFDRGHPRPGKYRPPKVAEKLKSARRSIAPAAYGLACFVIIFIAMLYLWASPLTWDEARSNVNRAVPPIGRGAVVACLVAIVVLSHALISYRYTGGKVSALFHLENLSENSRLGKLLERRRQQTNQWLLLSLGQYLLPISIIASSYFWKDKLFSEEIVKFLSEHQPYATLCGLLIAYLLGGLIRDLQRHRYRMFAVPLYCTAFLFAVLVLAIVFSGDPVGMHAAAGELGKTGPWVLLVAAVIFVLGPQIRPLLRRVQKAELPGLGKFELGEIDKVQQTVSPWRKTITRFDELVKLVVELIDETDNEDVVRFLAYTPALGFLTRPEKEWEPLHALLTKKRNIQITCLDQKDLSVWHHSFNGKPTQRPSGKINLELIAQANVVSQVILDSKRKQSRFDRRVRLVELKRESLPGYYLFANSKRAIISVPLFLPPKESGEATADPNPDSADFERREMPVTMLGFESTDNWTVWLVNKVCERYVKLAEKPASKT
jgi:hypothetical protein